MENFIECLFDSDYQIGDNGSVKSIPRTKLGRSDTMKGATRLDGYRMYYFKTKWYYAHRLVAQHFCPNPHNYNEVNHIDGNKANNHYTNLEWCTKSQNQRHRIDVLGQKHLSGKDHWNYGKEVTKEAKQLMSEAKTGINHPKFKGYYCFNGVKYTSSSALSLVTGRSHRSIIRCCNLNLKGYSFEPIDV